MGLQLDLRGNGVALAAKKALGAGALGQVHTVAFSGQHPLMWGVRPSWYFQEGCHGGTINDLFIHAADGVECLTGRQIAGVVAARAWNANLPQCPSFQVGAQVMLRLDNDGGAIGDVSYLAPTKAGYSVPSYWRFLIHGDKGEMEFGITGSVVRLTTHDDAATREIPAEPKISAVYLKDFLAEVKGESREGMLATPQVLRASRIALEAQQAADK